MPDEQYERSDAVTGEGRDAGAPFPVVAERFPSPKLASEARHDAATKPPEAPTTILSCGDFGGVARHKVVPSEEAGDEADAIFVDEPCDHPSSFGIPGAFYGITPGRCFKHTDEALSEKARRKAAFLDAFCEAPELGVLAACEKVGMPNRTTVYWWRDHDPEFRKNFSAIMEISEAMCADLVEERILTRILDPKSGADTLRMWWLQNRRGDRWKTAAKAGQGDTYQGGPVVKGGQHVWLVGDERRHW